MYSYTRGRKFKKIYDFEESTKYTRKYSLATYRTNSMEDSTDFPTFAEVSIHEKSRVFVIKWRAITSTTRNTKDGCN